MGSSPTPKKNIQRPKRPVTQKIEEKRSASRPNVTFRNRSKCPQMIPNDWLTYLRKSPVRLFFIQPCLGKPMVTKSFGGLDRLTNHYLWDDCQPKACDSTCAILPWKRFYDHMTQTQTTQTLKGLDFAFFWRDVI